MTLSGAQLVTQTEPLWFCLKTQPKREHLAAAALRKIPGLDVVSPRIRFRRATRRGPVWFVEAMFPGYIFASFHYADMHRQVQHVHGVVRVVGFGERIGVIDAGTVEQIRSAAGEEEVIVYSPELQVGDTVKIAEGAFQGLDAVITRLLPAKERVTVLLEFLGRELQAELTAPQILPSAPPRSAFAKT